DEQLLSVNGRSMLRIVCPLCEIRRPLLEHSRLILLRNANQVSPLGSIAAVAAKLDLQMLGEGRWQTISSSWGRSPHSVGCASTAPRRRRCGHRPRIVPTTRTLRLGPTSPPARARYWRRASRRFLL